MTLALRAAMPLSLALAVAAWAAAAPTAQAADAPPGAAIVASGLNNPSGLGIGPDGSLWIAEMGVNAGSGPSTTVRGVTLTYNTSGSLTRVAGGTQARLVTGLPALYAVQTGALEGGVNDIEFDALGRPLLLMGGGIDPAVRFTDLAPVGFQFQRLVGFGTAADIGAYETANNPDGRLLDSNPFRGARAPDGGMLVADAGANALFHVTAGGMVSTRAVFGPRNLGGPFPTESVPTGVAVAGDGTAFVGELTGFPFPGGQARVHRVAADGSSSVIASGFTMIVDIALAPSGKLFVLEYDINGLLQPGVAGRLWEVDAQGGKTLAFADGLDRPVGLAIDAAGQIFVARRGAEAGMGDVLRVTPIPEPGTWALLAAGLATVTLVAARRRTAREAARA